MQSQKKASLSAANASWKQAAIPLKSASLQKEDVLIILSERLGCPASSLNFLFSVNTSAILPLDTLTIPDPRTFAL